jgi:hypothetical protein
VAVITGGGEAGAVRRKDETINVAGKVAFERAALLPLDGGAVIAQR